MRQRHITFCLCPQFPLFCIASALEVLRHANRLSNETIYQWSFLCEDDEPVMDSNGLWLHPSSRLNQACDADRSFIVAGFDADIIDSPRLSRWLNKQARAGHVVGGISNGAFQLAKAGLLDGYAATSHWEDFEAFCLSFPLVRTRYQRFVLDRNRVTCSGGTATLDLFIEIVRDDHNSELAMAVAKQMLLRNQTTLPGNTAVISDDSNQHYSPRAHRVLSLLDAGIEQGFGVEQLANRVGISRRELLRLMQRETGKTPSQLLHQRRLERARSLVIHSHLPLATISTSLGFSSQSHLTTHYKNYYGTTPALHRRQHRELPDSQVV